MKQGRFTDEQIVRILQEADQDSVAEVAKRHGISQPTIYAWRKKFGLLDTDEVKRLKGLVQESARVLKLLVLLCRNTTLKWEILQPIFLQLTPLSHG
jgi:putative transposase